MSLFDTIKRTLGGSATPTPAQPPTTRPAPEPQEIKVVEVATADLMAERQERASANAA